MAALWQLSPQSGFFGCSALYDQNSPPPGIPHPSTVLALLICIVYLAPHGQGLGTRMDTERFKTGE